ncbi:MAG: hypothetical protein IJ887_05960 [Prevotella sp.]|nr:hypothetical protein [Prevotella sp.]MBR3480275.1 hypothetical protein [Prevotella sp.]
MKALPQAYPSISKRQNCYKKNIITYLFAFVTLASCSNNPQWADEEAHEKTEQLRKQYTRR